MGCYIVYPDHPTRERSATAVSRVAVSSTPFALYICVCMCVLGAQNEGQRSKTKA